MAEAKRDDNFVTTLLAVSSVDGVTPVTLYANPTTHRLLVDLAGSGTGDVVGPASATDNAVARFDATTGKLIQNSAVTIDDSGSITIPQGQFIKSGANTIFGGNGFNTLFRPDSSGGEMQFQSFAGVTRTTMFDSGAVTFTGDVTVPDEAYGVGWNGSLEVPTKNAVYDKIETLGGSGTVTSVSVVTANGVSGSVATATTTPAITLTLGAITPTTVNGNTFTTGTGVLTLSAGKTLTVSNTITLAGTDSTVMTFPTTSATIARTDSAQTFTGVQTMTSPALTTPAITGLATGTGVASAATASTLMTRNADANAFTNNLGRAYATTATAAGTTTLTAASAYTQRFTGVTTQTVVLPVVTTLTNGHQFYIFNSSSGVVTVQTSGGNVLSTMGPGNTLIVTVADTAGGTGTASWIADRYAVGAAAGKAATFSNSLTLAGTDGTTMTFPGSSDTVATLAATQTLTSKRVTPRTGTTTSSATPTINTDNVDFYSITAQTVDITSFTTNLSGTPTDGQKLWIAITGTAARAITWGASFEASTVALPTTTVTTARLDVGFVWNSVSSKWRCVASA